MDAFTFVVFGFTSNLAQLKIIPALYDLEEKEMLSPETKIIGIGRKAIDPTKFISDVLHTENRHHLHTINSEVESKLVSRVSYLQEDFENEEGDLYTKLETVTGNVLYYLATYPNLYAKIFKSLNDNNLNNQGNGWVRVLIEKPIGSNLETAKELNNLLNEYFEENQIFRVDHYLGKDVLRNVFGSAVKSADVDRIEITISEDFGIGKRGVYYDATGALIDMGQNHILQMLAAVIATNAKSDDRAEVLESLMLDRNNIIFGQYNGYLNEESVNPNSNTDTFFALKTETTIDSWKGVPIYLASGKKLDKNETKISIFYKNGENKTFLLAPLSTPEEFDPYERLILDALKGDQTFFNSIREVEASWKFIDKLSVRPNKPFIYEPGSSLADLMASKFTA